MNILAIDPGISGAVVLLGPFRLECRRDFETLADIDLAIGEFALQAEVAVIEFVHAMPGQGVSSTFTFGEARGAAMGALGSRGFRLAGQEDEAVLVNKPLIEVTPQRWQGYYRTTGLAVLRMEGIPAKQVFDSVGTCLRVLPHSAQFLRRVKDHNTADAILMALWYSLNRDVPTVQRKSKKKKRTSSKPKNTK